MIVEIALGIVLAVIILDVISANINEIVDFGKFIVGMLLLILLIYLVDLACIRFLPPSVYNFILDAIIFVIIFCIVIVIGYVVYLCINWLINAIKFLIKYIKINRSNNERK